MTTVRPIQEADRDAWLPLWHGYNAFYRNEPTDEVTRKCLCDGSADLIGLVAEDDFGGLIGLAHLVFQPSTWTTRTHCYLEDLFVSRGGRGSGADLALIEGAYAEADRRSSDRVYRHTQQCNAPARSLYDTVGHATSFVVYER